MLRAKFSPFAAAAVAMSLIAAVLPGVSNAATYLNGSNTATFDVTLKIVANCVIAAAPLDFGQTQGVLASAVNVSTTLNVTCTNSTPYNVASMPVPAPARSAPRAIWPVLAAIRPPCNTTCSRLPAPPSGATRRVPIPTAARAAAWHSRSRCMARCRRKARRFPIPTSRPSRRRCIFKVGSS